MTCELEHVVGVAGFGGAVAEPVGEFTGLAQVFMNAVAADDVAVVVHHRFPEEAAEVMKVFIAGHFVLSCGADDFWDLGI